MKLREKLAISICGAIQFEMPPLVATLGHGLAMAEDQVLIPCKTRCVCRRDGRTPIMTIPRCANCLSKADATIETLKGLGVPLPE